MSFSKEKSLCFLDFWTIASNSWEWILDMIK